MKRILSLIALALCMVMLFCSCGLSFIDKKAEVTPVAYDQFSAERISALDGYTARDTNSTCILLSKAGDAGAVDWRVYNYMQDATVYSITITAAEATSVSVSLDEAMVVVTKTENGETRYNLHSCYENASLKSMVKSYELINDTLYADGTVFRMDEETMQVTDTYELNELGATIPTCTGWNDDYYYEVDSYNTYKLTIYDNHYNYLMTYEIPSYATSVAIGVSSHFLYFRDGAVIAQYFVRQPDTEKKYDLIVGASKYDMHSFKITPKNQKVEEIELDMFVASVIDKKQLDKSNNVYKLGKKEDLATGWQIENQRISTSYDTLKYFYINSDGKYDTSIGEYDGDNVVYDSIGNGYIMRESLKSERVFLLNNKGEEIGAIDGAQEITMKYLMTQNAIYDYELTKLADLGDYNYFGTVGNNFLFSCATTSGIDDIYIYNGSFKKIGTEDTYNDTLCGDSLYGLNEESGVCYYDAAGNKLFGGLNAAPTVTASNSRQNIYLVRTVQDSQAVYYRISPNA